MSTVFQISPKKISTKGDEVQTWKNQYVIQDEPIKSTQGFMPSCQHALSESGQGYHPKYLRQSPLHLERNSMSLISEVNPRGCSKLKGKVF